MPDKIEIAAVTDLDNGEMKLIDKDGLCLTLVKDGSGKYHCLQGMCPHQDIPLAEGDLIGDEIQCAGHGWKFNINTGECNANPYCEAMIYKLQIEDEKVFFISGNDK